MYIIQTNLSDEETDKANDRIAEEIEKRGGAILERERIGKKRLAYPIRKSEDGAYYLMHFDLPPAEIGPLREAYRLHPRLLRFLILRKEGEEVAKLHKRKTDAEQPPTPEKVTAEAEPDESAAGEEAQEADPKQGTEQTAPEAAQSDETPSAETAQTAGAESATEDTPEKQE